MRLAWQKTRQSLLTVEQFAVIRSFIARVKIKESDMKHYSETWTLKNTERERERERERGNNERVETFYLWHVTGD